MIDFNEVLDRKLEHAAKHCELTVKYGKTDLLPLWIADMDFKVAPAIQSALVNRVAKGVFGYTTQPDAYEESIVSWVKKRHQWHIQKDQLIYSPSVMTSVGFFIQQMTKPGDGIIIQEPVYGPFKQVVLSSKRRVMINPLKVDDRGRYTMDYDVLDQQLKEAKCLILCNPHNPVGRVWTKDELRQLGLLCIKHKVLVISDEIHCDLILSNQTFTPFASISDQFSNMSMTCMSPTKSFNIPGLQTSFVFTSNPEFYGKMLEIFALNDLKRNNCFGLEATIAAYGAGEKWLNSALDYIEGNMDFTIEFIEKHMKKLKVRKPEGTYLLWIDFNGLQLSSDDLRRLIIQDAGLALADGMDFGQGGHGFQRMNMACSRRTIEKALLQLKSAYDDQVDELIMRAVR